MGAVLDWLDGKKTILAGALVGLIGSLSALGVKLPSFLTGATGDTIIGVLGALVILGRVFATKQLAGASPTLTPPAK